MREKLRLFITISTVVPFLFGSASALVSSISVEQITSFPLQLNSDQLGLVLLLCVCFVSLFELLAERVSHLRVNRMLSWPVPSLGFQGYTLLASWWTLTVLLGMLGVVVPILDLIGSLPFSIDELPHFSVKISLMLLVSFYIYHVIEGSHSEDAFLERLLREVGQINLFDRDQDHAFMSQMLDELAPQSEIFVTHFEEPVSELQIVSDSEKPSAAYYYEQSFMEKWYKIIHEKQLRVCQLLLINGDDDIRALRDRMRVVKDIPTYSLAFIVAPPMLFFADFILVPEKFLLIGFSDRRESRNMNVFSVLIRGSETVRRFENIFRNILLPESRPVKTFEGCMDDNVAWLEDYARRVSRISSPLVRDLYSFSRRR